MVGALFDTNILIDYLNGLEPAKKIKLPDAIVWATALVNKRLLVTRNTKDFSADEPGTRVPYQV